MGFIGSLALVAFAVLSGDRPGSVTVPSILHLSRSEAERRLERQGFRWRYAGDETVRSEPIPSAAPLPELEPGTAVIGTPYVLPDPEVLGQRPRGGAVVATGTIVEIEVRGGGERLLENLAESERRRSRADERRP